MRFPLFISVYILIGVLLNFLHPELKNITPILRRVYQPTIGDYIEIGRYNPWWKRILAIVIIRFILIVISPAVCLIDLIHNLSRRLLNIILRRYEEDNYDYLYLFSIKGAGEASCMVCGYTAKIAGFVDGGPGSEPGDVRIEHNIAVRKTNRI